jgi:hypothetical protein
MATAAETVRRSVTGGSKAAPAGRVGECGNGVRGGGDHGVVDSPGSNDRYTEAEAGEDQCVVVGLGDGVSASAVAAGGNGLPVATSARPSVHRIRSSGTASALEVGWTAA